MRQQAGFKVSKKMCKTCIYRKGLGWDMRNQEERDRCDLCGGWIASSQEDTGLDPICECEAEQESGQWTHSICEWCWDKRRPGVEPGRLVSPQIELCCFCGNSTKSGIYVREDPKELTCTHRMESES